MNYFEPREFACKCGRPKCDAEAMDIGFVFKLNGLRLAFGQPMHINSGVRCTYWNEHEGGAKDSMHLRGRAVDVACPDGSYMRALAFAAYKAGFRIGIKKGMIHLDDSAPLVMWGY